MRWRAVKKNRHHPSKSTEPPSVSYASYASRVKAFITDMFMIYTPILYILAYVVLDGKDAFQSSQVAPLGGVILYAVIYSAFLARSGQTPGKKAYDIKVVDADTFERISFFRALFRFVAFLFSATIIYGLLTPFFRKDDKALHDLITQTVVIEDTAKEME